MNLYHEHAELCKTLAHPKRLELINFLRNGEKSVNELVRKMEISQSNISQHLAILRQNGIVITKRRGKNIYYTLAYPEMSMACDIIKNVLIKQIKSRGNLAKELRKK